MRTVIKNLFYNGLNKQIIGKQAVQLVPSVP